MLHVLLVFFTFYSRCKGLETWINLEVYQKIQIDKFQKSLSFKIELNDKSYLGPSHDASISYEMKFYLMKENLLYP